MTTEAIAAPISLTTSAVDEIKRLMNESGFNSAHLLRVGVKGGGCAGMTYVLDFGAQESDDDVFEIGGIPVLLKKAHGIYLMGMTVDFEHGLNARGFVFQNPNASSTCGCGTSFAV
ncbi:MAG: iron-sulfur cluster assembly accessory protein [Chitinophagia bacterium]|nr:iron-sulfur cluster assembly accessory protein [Chitinophagia bacterium]